MTGRSDRITLEDDVDDESRMDKIKKVVKNRREEDEDDEDLDDLFERPPDTLENGASDDK